MTPPRRRLHLSVFLRNVGQHEAAWRAPGARAGDVTDIGHYRALAQTAERGTLDAVFFADHPVLKDRTQDRPWDALDPVTLLAAVSGATHRIGLVATASTTYNEPYGLARRLATLDHVSRGRAGWNVVTTVNARAAANFGGAAHPEPQRRYARAAEFIEVASALWDSWAPDAIVDDQAAGVFARPDRIRAIDHAGEHFRVAGPLEVPRSPQGRPVIFQAGSSEAGTALAARHADVVFTAQPGLDGARAFRSRLRAQAAAAGRDPDAVRVMPGLSFFIGGTEQEARRQQAGLDALMLPSYGLAELQRITGADFHAHALDEPVKVPARPTGQGHLQSRHDLLHTLTHTETLTLRQLLQRLGAGRGHFAVAGTPEQVAGVIADWFAQGAADGFNLIPPLLPSSLSAFVDQVVPLLRRRGLFREDYEGTTLRDHLGLPQPPSTW